MSQSTDSGITFCGLLGIIFITLKLCHVIDWSWWWILLPLYGGLVFIVSIFVTFIVIAGTLALIKDLKR